MASSYFIRELTEQEFWPLFRQHKQTVFAGDHSYDLHTVLSESEQAHLKELNQNLGTPYKLFLGAFAQDNQCIGWSWGFQENATTYYMVNSAVIKEHRRKGVYSALLQKTVAMVSEKGFQLIYSRHCATNNSVIIPKLKAGFIISKMEIDDRFGVLIHLHHYSNTTRRKIMDYRAGQAAPDEEIQAVFNLT